MGLGSILIVDDNADNLKLMLAMLSPLGCCELRTASDGPGALTALENFDANLVLLDLQLPGLDGLTVARRLEADPARRDIPIVAVTAYAMRGDENKAREAGCDGYLTKPVDKRALRSLVKRLLHPEPAIVQRG